jgi:uncharacterized NAD(P)/FAD-binding protein YdhS
MRLAIVGGGASAVMLLHAFRKHLPDLRGLRIDIFERAGRFGRGQAYSASSSAILLNTPAVGMGIGSAHVDGFADYLTIHGMDSEYVPRRVYGNYLEQCLSEDLAVLRAGGVAANLHHSEVTSLQPGPPHVVVTDNDTIHADYCIIASGGTANSPASHLEGNPRYIPSVMREDLMTTIEPGSRIGIVGASQSAVDACIWMEKHGINGYYSLLSRNGFLPRVKNHSYCSLGARGILAGCRTAEDARFKISRLIRWKSSRANYQPAAGSLRQFGLDIRRARRKLPSWQRVMGELTHELNHFWQQLDEPQHRDFFEKDFRMLYHLRNAIPVRSAEVVLGLHADRRLDILVGTYRLLERTDTFVYRNCATERKFDYIVNAAGLSPRGVFSYLKASTREGRRLGLNVLGGVRVNPTTMAVLENNGTAVPGLYALGYPTQGSLLMVNSIELLRPCAEAIANAVHQRLNPLEAFKCA